ncbi:MAG: acetyl-CoA carboxylase biotin carboxylase subunit [Planctomycetes bacterium]|nr:acetyl-CoA carboxylase biotin carboxylase subunit [Planctomycetota bacterium]MBI3835623.1 acetyl-CoA carboxylase biotin carboxylase subunit [Planctomycetota bacterium]
MFKRVLIANRGEIAVRVAATLQQMGITAIAVNSDPDRGALHVTSADEAYPLEGSAAAETYLRIDKLIDIARKNKVDAIHPGYGFLSENGKFAAACENAGITFIGPKAEVIRRMGNKVEAKQVVQQVGVPIVPGWSGGATSTKELAIEAKRIGFPLLIKAAAGGGGKGMRLVTNAAEFTDAVESARREATAAFGSDQVFLEKYIARPRHVEFQIFGDEHGNVVHLFERECSVQRRHQKVVEESPSPALTPELRSKMGDAAVRAAKAVGYSNAGTVEFLLGEDGQFYFLEMNTRLQVEHPVTEMITGLDLVRLQLEIASGGKLTFTQDGLLQTGHAMECRIYAEDTARGFLPSTGTLLAYEAPRGPGIRVDSGFEEGSEVTVHYDPMLAKLIVWDRGRDESIRKMQWALERFVVLGVTTNIGFLRALLANPEFRGGRLHTHFLEEQRIVEDSGDAPPVESLIAAALGIDGAARIGKGKSSLRSADAKDAFSGPWTQADRWRVA